jgi:uncharacterized membrane protein
MTPLIAILLIVVACVIGGVAALALKIGSAKPLTPKHLIRNYTLMLGLILYGLATVLFIPALKYGQLSILYPLTSLTQVFVVIFSVYFLKEKMNKWRWFAVVAILLGVTLLSIGG